MGTHRARTRSHPFGPAGATACAQPSVLRSILCSVGNPCVACPRVDQGSRLPCQFRPEADTRPSSGGCRASHHHQAFRPAEPPPCGRQPLVRRCRRVGACGSGGDGQRGRRVAAWGVFPPRTRGHQRRRPRRHPEDIRRVGVPCGAERGQQRVRCGVRLGPGTGWPSPIPIAACGWPRADSDLELETMPALDGSSWNAVEHTPYLARDRRSRIG
jgi:hypothetical protein